MLSNQKRMFSIICVLILLTVISGCRITVDPDPNPNPDPDPNPVNPIEQLYKQNLLKWQNQNLKSYDYVFQSVQNNQIESIRWIETFAEVAEDRKTIFLSVEQIFELIKSAIDKDAATIRVNYDFSYGYPTNVYIDYDERIADEEVSIRSSFLEVSPNGPKPLPTSCEPYSTDSYEYIVASELDVNFATLQIFSEDSGLVKACVRSQHTSGCVEAVEVSSSYKKGEFRLTRNLVPINTFIACTAAITPYAKFVELNVEGLEPGTYPVNYFSSNDAPNPQIKTTVDLKASRFSSCLPDGVNDQTIVTATMQSTANGQTFIEKVTVVEKLSTMQATCTDNKLRDVNAKEIRFYRLVGCWGARPDDADEQLARQSAEISALEETYTVVTLTCNPGGIPYP